jgi:uncharacterized protein GlcG (DUF336 family)
MYRFVTFAKNWGTAGGTIVSREFVGALQEGGTMMNKMRIAVSGGVGYGGVSIRKLFLAGAAGSLIFAGAPAHATGDCPVSYRALKTEVQTAAADDSTGLNNNYWAVVVDSGGVVCAVAYSGSRVGDQWLSSRQIAAAKAFTANGLSLDSAPLSTAQLYRWVQPSNPDIGNPLFGLEGGNVLNSFFAYQGDYSTFGTQRDPMVGKRVGGTISFGGGLGLYQGTRRIGGIGLSGDTACADHSVAWRIRYALGMKPTAGDDRLTFATNLENTNGHPHCPNDTGTKGTTN